MKWIPQEVETYLNEKEYVDTAVIPLYSVSFGDEMKQSAAMAEFITLLTFHLERQFTGRLLLIPPFTYIKNEKSDIVINELKKWEEYIEESEFKHIFYITSESEWKLHEESLTGSLIWIPSIPLEHMNESQKMSIIDSQVKQLLNLFTRKWHEIE
ncbi:YpiF family protein [Neobacillus pocheonensis]|uniref:YpiF family protein n=1 Tax=Neobacillus pocheonensis TaxID=363869 RepID=A0ABT0W8I5_9BACI|nr:YpiF family protein [Neobacillus pocheonensis]